jgi:hypothetical protein
MPCIDLGNLGRIQPPPRQIVHIDLPATSHHAARRQASEFNNHFG